MKNNIPPFHVGQKVVCVEGYACFGLNEGQKYVIRSVSNTPCCGLSLVNVGSKPTHHDYIICTCGSKYKNTGCLSSMYRANRFRPLQKMTAPLLTFEKIKEEEKEEILTLN